MTGNAHKFAEAQQILKPYGIELTRHAASYPEIRAEDVEEVALASAKSIFAEMKKPLIVEDSGLFIPVLNDFPGAYSAWVQKKLGNAGILKLLEGGKSREAYFKTTVAYVDSKIVKSFSGVVRGTISEKEKGSGGFGYDSIFIPHNEVQPVSSMNRGKGDDSVNPNRLTFAENETLKNRISHRFNAFTEFAKWYSHSSRRKTDG